MRGLRVDYETHVLSMQYVVNRSPECSFLELMPTTDTLWTRYLESALHSGWSIIILVCAYEKQCDKQQD
jgi:hypothetical protein